MKIDDIRWWQISRRKHYLKTVVGTMNVLKPGRECGASREDYEVLKRVSRPLFHRVNADIKAMVKKIEEEDANA